jgi:hypothetical protein
VRAIPAAARLQQEAAKRAIKRSLPGCALILGMTHDPKQLDDGDVVDFVMSDWHTNHSEYRGQDIPRVLPDHGAQPRRPKRPTLVVWNRDPQNLYKPADNAFLDEREIPPSASDLRKRDLVRMLGKTARDHASRLHWRTDKAVKEFIEREALPAARFVASSLPTGDLPKVLASFTEVLWDEITLHRKKSKSQECDIVAKIPHSMKTTT